MKRENIGFDIDVVDNNPKAVLSSVGWTTNSTFFRFPEKGRILCFFDVDVDIRALKTCHECDSYNGQSECNGCFSGKYEYNISAYFYHEDVHDNLRLTALELPFRLSFSDERTFVERWPLIGIPPFQLPHGVFRYDNQSFCVELQKKLVTESQEIFKAWRDKNISPAEEVIAYIYAGIETVIKTVLGNLFPGRRISLSFIYEGYGYIPLVVIRRGTDSEYVNEPGYFETSYPCMCAYVLTDKDYSAYMCHGTRGYLRNIYSLCLPPMYSAFSNDEGKELFIKTVPNIKTGDDLIEAIKRNECIE